MNVVKTCANLGYLTAVCDKDLHPLEEIRSRYDDVGLYCDFDTMLELGKITAVAIAAPAQNHAEFALRALRAGLDVFVEKPLALSVEDAERVVECAVETGRKLVVGHVLLYHPAVQAMLAMISSGAIGEVRHVRSRRSSWGRLREHEDVWWSFAPHDVALVLAIFGEEPESASGSAGAYVRPHIADVAYGDFRFSMGRTAHVEVNWIDPQKNSQTDVFGSTGVLSFCDGADGGTLRYTPCGDRLSAGGTVELVREETVAVAVSAGEPLAIEIEAFARFVRGGRVPPTDGREGLAVVRALSMVGDAVRSARASAIAE
jgi:UDP-2-acetamido-3-amino-2,3-dideoxy-glucuronate N-acetyltransferase